MQRIDRLPQEIRVGGSVDASAVLLLPDKTAITIPSPSLLQFTGAGWQISSGNAEYDRKMLAKQGGGKICQDCYEEIYADIFSSIANNLYGSTRTDTSLLRELQRYKAHVFLHIEEARYSKILKNMKRYDYLAGRLGHVPDGDPLWGLVPSVEEEKERIERDFSYTPIVDTTKENSKVGW